MERNEPFFSSECYWCILEVWRAKADPHLSPKCVRLKSQHCRTCHCRSNDHEDKGDLESAKDTIFEVWAFMNL